MAKGNKWNEKNKQNTRLHTHTMIVQFLPGQKICKHSFFYKIDDVHWIFM